MSNPTCETCRWWTRLGDGTPRYQKGLPNAEKIPYGKCHRMPPVLRNAMYDFLNGHPSTLAADFCGEHSPKPENKQ